MIFFISKRQHKKEMEALTELSIAGVNLIGDVSKKEIELLKKKHEEEVLKLKSELSEAKDMKKIIERLVLNDTCFAYAADGSRGVDLPADVLRYVDDMFGGKVIKQDAVKGISINKDGKITVGLTKKADKGYSYRLVRE